MLRGRFTRGTALFQKIGFMCVGFNYPIKGVDFLGQKKMAFSLVFFVSLPFFFLRAFFSGALFPLFFFYFLGSPFFPKGLFCPLFYSKFHDLSDFTIAP